MQVRRAFLVLFLLIGSGAGVGYADDDGQSTDRRMLLARGLDLVRARVQAQVGLADTLREAGRLDEAIAAYRQATTIYDTELKRIQNLIGFVLNAPPTKSSVLATPARTQPFEGPGPNSSIGLGSTAGGGGFRGRGGAGKIQSTRKGFLNAVDAGLRWLSAHQTDNGGWSAEGFGGWCDGKPVAAGAERPDGPGDAQFDVGVTGLALCAFLGAGYTNRGKHDFARTVGMGLRYLKNVQDPEGCFGPRTSQMYIYNHAVAALAMVEAYGMTGSPIFKGSAQRALDFIMLARNPYFGWRYGIKPGDNDTSVTGWMLMPLKSAQIINRDMVARGRPAPLVIDESAFLGVKAWLEKVTDADSGQVGYLMRGTGAARPQELLSRFPADKSESMTAVGLVSRIFIGEDPQKSPVIQKGAARLRKLPPVWNPSDGSIDMYYWYAGSLAAFQVGGETWNTWRSSLQSQVLPHQRMDTTPCLYKGSWDPIGPWGPRGGRVYSTALMTLSFETFYRYERVFGTK